MDKPLLFSTASYEYMRHRMREYDFYDGSLERKTFPDGERYQRISTDVEGHKVVLVGGTISDADLMEIYDLSCGLVKYGCSRLDLVIPYFGYSTMERAVKPGEIVAAKTRARLLSAIPIAPEGNRIFLLDLHAEGIPHYFEGNVRPVHVYAKDVVKKMIRYFGGTCGGLGEYVVACTDAGRAKWVESLANDLGVSASFVFKKRLDGDKTEITGISANVNDKTVVIYDDMLRTGGSMVSAAEAYKNEGAKEIYAVFTHCSMLKGVQNLIASNLFAGIGTTNSHAIVNNHGVINFTGSVIVESVAELLSKKVHGIP